MIRLNDKEVELDAAELAAQEHFQGMLDKGHSITGAIRHMRGTMPWLSEEFFQYLGS